MRGVELRAEGLSVRTSGLSSAAHPELSASVADAALLGECGEFLRFAAAYVGRGARLRAEQTLAYGYWLTKFREAGEDLLEVWEYAADAAGFVPGATLTLG